MEQNLERLKKDYYFINLFHKKDKDAETGIHTAQYVCSIFLKTNAKAVKKKKTEVANRAIVINREQATRPLLGDK